MPTKEGSKVDTLSVVVPCYNDFENLKLTLRSLSDLHETDEIVIVDSSESTSIGRGLVEAISLKCRMKYLWTKPEGVYSAQNLGISNAGGNWVQILNSGDSLSKNGRYQISKAVEENPEIEIHVFAQESGLDNVPSIAFYPRADGIWPHQSIVVSAQIYRKTGLYDLSYKVSADQIYFANARRMQKWKIHDFSLTHYDLSGFSSNFSFSYCKELYFVWRALGFSTIGSFTKSFVSPVLGTLVKFVVGTETQIKIKKLLPRYAQK